MPLKRMSTFEAPVLTHATIEKLVAHSVATVLEAQAAIMASINNPNSKPRKTPVARKCTYKNKCAEKNKVRYAVSTLTKEALFWWNSFTQSIGIEEAYVGNPIITSLHYHVARIQEEKRRKLEEV
ncbi:hypothetical protein Tco_0202808 [Tanacetum coccineum]